MKLSAEKGEPFVEAARNSAEEAVKGAEKTKEMIASKGRATYVGERSINFPDAGATAIGVIFNEVIQKFKNRRSIVYF